MGKGEIPYDVLRDYIKNILVSQSSEPCSMRTLLRGDKDILVRLEFTKGYEHAVRVVHDAFCLLDVDGVSSVDSRQMEAFKSGLEGYIAKVK